MTSSHSQAPSVRVPLYPEAVYGDQDLIKMIKEKIDAARGHNQDWQSFVHSRDHFWVDASFPATISAPLLGLLLMNTLHPTTPLWNALGWFSIGMISVFGASFVHYKKRLKKRERAALQSIFDFDQTYSPGHLESAIAQGHWSDPMLMDICGVHGSDLRPLTDEEIEGLDAKVTSSALPELIDAWKKMLAAPGVLRQFNAAHIMQKLQAAQDQMNRSSQSSRQRLLQKHGANQEVLIITDERELAPELANPAAQQQQKSA